MNASGRTLLSLKAGLFGASLVLALTAVPAALTAQKTAVAVGLKAPKKNQPIANVVVIPAPPILHHGIVQPAGPGPSAAADADDVRQDAIDPSHAHDAATGQDLTWDPDKKSWVETKSGQALGFNGMLTTDGMVIPAPPVLHHGVVLPAVDGVNARADADDVHQYDRDPDHAYDRTTHQSLYWDPKKGSWFEVVSGHSLGFDGVPVVASAATRIATQAASAPTQAASATTQAATPAITPAPPPVVAEKQSTPAAATHSAAPLGPVGNYNSEFTIGWAAGMSWTKATGLLAGTNPQTITTVAIPSAQYLIQWNAARNVSLGLYLGGTYLKQASTSSASGPSTPGSSATSLNFGLEPDIYFLGRSRSNDIRVFVGPGLWYTYSQLGATTASAYAHQFAASGMLGAELPIWREGRMRAGLVYGHDFQNTNDNLPAANYYAFNLGLMFDAPGGAEDNYVNYEDNFLPAFSIRYGSELGFTSYGAVNGVAQANDYTFALPTQTVGGYAGIGSTRQLRIGSDLDFSRVSTSGTSLTYLGLEPGLEYYLLPHAYKGWDVRVRGFGVLEYQSANASGGGYSASTHGWLTGYGAEGMLTHHFFGPQLIGFGLSYAHVGDNMSLQQAAQNTLNLKITIDSKLY